MSLHVDRLLPRLLQQTNKLEHRFILEPYLRLCTVCQTTVGRGLDLKSQIIRSEGWLLKSSREDRGQGDRKRVERSTCRCDEDQLHSSHSPSSNEIGTQETRTGVSTTNQGGDKYVGRTRLSVRYNAPVSLSFLAPPDPPEEELPVGGASGMFKDTSTLEVTAVIVSSSGSGTGERSGVNIAQFNDISGDY